MSDGRVSDGRMGDSRAGNSRAGNSRVGDTVPLADTLAADPSVASPFLTSGRTSGSYEAEYSGCRFETVQMTKQLSAPRARPFCSVRSVTLGSGVACGGVAWPGGALLALSALLVGCGGVKPVGPLQERGAAGTAASEPETMDGELSGELGALSPGESSADAAADAAWQASTEPLYLVTTRVQSTGQAPHTFLLTVPAIGPGTRFTLEQAVEIDADTAAFGARGKPFAFAASASGPTVQRWRVAADGTLSAGPHIDFASLGMRRADFAGSLSFHSADKAYFCNQFEPSEVVIWNPETLELRGTIPLELPFLGTLRPQVVLSQRRDRLFVIVSWQQEFARDWTHFGDHVQVLAIDPASDTVVSRVDESRCNSFSLASTAADGTTYFSPAAYYAPLRSLLGEPSGVESCLLRIMPGADSFDATYGQDLSELVGGRPAGDLALVTESRAFLRVWHSELVTPLADGNANWEAVLQEPGFQWWTWRVGEPEAAPIAEQQGTTVGPLLQIDGKTYTTALAADGGSSQLLELNAEGALQPGLSGVGQILGVFRVR